MMSPQMIAALAQRGGAPSAVPSGLPTPAAGPGMSPGGAPNPMAMLAGRGAPGGGLPPQQMQMLMFLAGMGFPEFAKSMNSMKPKEPKHGQTGTAADAARSPQQAMIPPQLLQAALTRGATPNPAMAGLIR